MAERIEYAKVALDVTKAMRGLEEQIKRSTIERPLITSDRGLACAGVAGVGPVEG
ncbi:MAG TPA: hypothetical protein VM580_35670 [Labilithrix sp.]|jgi:hypothetical protein|nr:hypothetical protein [Labilithrix sp.]